MKVTFPVLLLITALLFVGCYSANPSSGIVANKESSAPANRNSGGGADYDNGATSPNASKTAGEKPTQPTQPGQVSDGKTDNQQANNQAVERKIIRNAELVFEVSAPEELQRKISSIAETRGGYVVSSDSTQQGGTESTVPYKLVKIVLRVPSAEYNATMNDIKASGVGTAKQEKETGRDVTEEFIDLEARLKALKATEVQMTEIMKRANSVNELLTVQQQLGQLRAQIESLEGKLRYLQNQTSFSTITVTLQQPGTYIVSPTGFFYRLKRSIANGLDAAAEVILFLVQAALALLPLSVLVAIPTFFFVRYLKRRRRNVVLVQKLEDEANQER